MDRNLFPIVQKEPPWGGSFLWQFFRILTYFLNQPRFLKYQSRPPERSAMKISTP